MCAALWTRNLQHGLPSGKAKQLTSRDATSQLVAYASVSWRHGVVQVAATRDGVCAVSLYDDESAFRARAVRQGWSATHEPDWTTGAVEQLSAYFIGDRREFSVALDLGGTTEFDRRVLALIAAIPYGETRTYGDLARALGSIGAARAVGRACSRNPLPLLIPCHRVLRRGGAVSGYSSGGPDLKAALLQLERGGTAC